MAQTDLIDGECELKIFDLLIAACELRLCPAEEVSYEVGLTAHMDVAFMGATAESLIQGSAVALLFTAVQFSNQDVVRPQHFILTVSAKPLDKKVTSNQYSSFKTCQTQFVRGKKSILEIKAIRQSHITCVYASMSPASLGDRHYQ